MHSVCGLAGLDNTPDNWCLQYLPKASTWICQQENTQFEIIVCSTQVKVLITCLLIFLLCNLEHKTNGHQQCTITVAAVEFFNFNTYLATVPQLGRPSPGNHNLEHSLTSCVYVLLSAEMPGLTLPSHLSL